LAQTMYAHMNKWIKKKKKEFIPSLSVARHSPNTCSKLPDLLIKLPWMQFQSLEPIAKCFG
jgi:hypothetical protein